MDLTHPSLPKTQKVYTCQHCDSTEDVDYIYNNKPLCDGCYGDDYFTCDSCSEVQHTDDYYEDGLCNDCYWEDHFRCEGCDETYHNDYNYGHGLCPDCHGEFYIYCEDCGEDVDNEDCSYIEGYGDICDTCLEDSDLEVKECYDCHSQALQERLYNGLCLYCSRRKKNKLIHPTITNKPSPF